MYFESACFIFVLVSRTTQVLWMWLLYALLRLCHMCLTLLIVNSISCGPLDLRVDRLVTF